MRLLVYVRNAFLDIGLRSHMQPYSPGGKYGPSPRNTHNTHFKMKKLFHLLSILTLATLVAVRVNAGEYNPPPSKPAPELYGLGWYGAIDLGANIYQDRGDVRNFSDANGNTLRLDPTNDTGFFGGVKLGYVFGTGQVRFALEEDLFYNGWKTGADATLVVNGVTTTSSSSVTINTGAFMTNGLVKFSSGKFQPYIGFGIGAYYAESAGGNFGTFNTGGGASHADFAWQAIAGADYYFNPKWSTFVEYKFLEYTASQSDFGNSDSRVLGQQLLGGGLRFHF
jgi:opacity protein-like surface antigen